MEQNRKLTRLAILAVALLLPWLAGTSIRAQDAKPAPEPLKAEDFEKTKFLYFDMCAGCHGVLRKGATGPDLLPAKVIKLGQDYIKKIVNAGTPQGMPGWGKLGVLTEQQVDHMSRFLAMEPPQPGMINMKDIEATWKVAVDPDKRPTAPQHKRNWKNFVGVILRDAGKVAIIDGDTKENVAIIDSGYAVHILRSSASGRYFYSIGRDAKVTLIDLWMDPPAEVAQIKVGNDARSIEVSKYKGPEGDFSDKLAVVGCYWPPHLAILDGLTLKPMKLVSTQGFTYDENEYVHESRVASIVASHHSPTWIVCLKELGIVWMLNYLNVASPTITQISAERFLHDGGWDLSKRYFLVAANMRNKVCVIDAKTGTLAARVDVGVKPHPGRGATWNDPKYGPVWATVHLGSPEISIIGTDPEGHKDNAWKVVHTLDTAGGGSLFIKTHPNSSHLWADHTLNSDPKIAQTVLVYNLKDLAAPPKEIHVGDRGRVTHLEYDATGKEVWVSLWDRKGEIVIYDDTTLEVKARITGDWLVTPTGKFNVTNTAQDIY